MAARQKKQPPKKDQRKADKQLGNRKESTPPPPVLSHEPNVSPNAVDVTGIIPDDVRVDPDITEGHPGYEESGSSAIRPTR